MKGSLLTGRGRVGAAWHIRMATVTMGSGKITCFTDMEYFAPRISQWHSHPTVGNATRAHTNMAKNMGADFSISVMEAFTTVAFRITCEFLLPYTGSMIIYRFHGKGALQTALGDKLWGTWCRGKISGKGNIDFSNGDARSVSNFLIISLQTVSRK